MAEQATEEAEPGPAPGPATTASASCWDRPPDFSTLNTYKWSWDSCFTIDENYLDLACLVARNATAKDGHMGCVMVRDLEVGSGGAPQLDAAGELVLCTINSSLFGAHRSDCHAEANAISECAARGVATRGLSCYVTRSPCVACYKLLATAGIRRIVAPQPLDSPDTAASAAALGIECVVLRDSDARAERRQRLGTTNEDMERVQALREERKRLRKERGYGKKAIRKVAASATPTAATESETGAAQGREAGDL